MQFVSSWFVKSRAVGATRGFALLFFIQKKTEAALGISI